MKKLLSLSLAGLILFGSSAAVFAEDGTSDAPAAPAALTLADTSHLMLDTEAGYVDMIDGTVTVAELKAEFASAITVKGADGTAKADDAAVATDDTVAAADDSLKALIYGDVDRNGKVNLTDVTYILKQVAGWNPEMNADAADVDATGKVNLSDASKMMKAIAGWDDISLGNVRLVFENLPVKAENEDSGMDLFFDTPLIKRARSNTASTGEYAYKLKTARNETESCQFYLVSDESMEGMTVELSPFEHEYGEGTMSGEIFLHYYYEMTVVTNSLKENGPEINEYDYFPEPLLPLADSFELTADRSQGFNINITAGKDTPAGMYKAVLTVKDADGKAVKQANVYTYVWDFTLPDTPYSKSSFGMSGYGIYAELGRIDKKWYSGDDSKTHAEYYEFLLDHNVSSYQLPYSIQDSRADALMSDPRVTSFEICGENLRLPEDDNEETVLANFAKVQSNPVWEEKGHFYYVDEPYSAHGAELVKHQHEYLTELLGTDDFDIILPFFNSLPYEVEVIDMLDAITPYVDIYVPRSDGFMPNLEPDHYNQGLWTPRPAFIKYGENLPRLLALKEDPEKELWWYTCVDPAFPFPNLFTTQQGIMNRVIWWQQFMFDVNGFLYWATQSGWDTLSGRDGNPGVGDGLLLYLGQHFGREVPIASWRLIQVRDGFDDFDYLRMAEELVGREEILKIVHQLTTNVTHASEDPNVMEACRDAIAEIIVANQAK